MSKSYTDEDVRALLDKQAIHDVLTRYARGVDRCDEDLLRSVYHENSWDYHGAFEGTGAEFAARPERRSSRNLIVHHAMCGVHIELDGDVARCETYYVCTHLREETPGERAFGQIFGRYLDRFERRAGEWRIAVRRAVVDLSLEQPEGPIWPAAPTYPTGKRWPDDPVYRFDEFVTRARAEETRDA